MSVNIHAKTTDVSQEQFHMNRFFIRVVLTELTESRLLKLYRILLIFASHRIICGVEL